MTGVDAKFQIEEKLDSSSGMGQSYRIRDKSNCVKLLKVVETKDYSDSRLIVEELSKLQHLSHPYIALPSDLYPNFDTKDSVSCVHLIRTFSEKGSVDAYLLKKRSTFKEVPELQIRKWIGQLVDVLHYLHRNDALHRNLKPANMILGTTTLYENETERDQLLQVCDFGSTIAMTDYRTRTRSPSEDYYTAPEAARHPFDKRCDCWSLGASLLDISSCSVTSQTEIQRTLIDAKRTSKAIQPVLMKIAAVYSTELTTLIGGLLKVDPTKRFTVRDLLRNDYVLSCLQLTNSSIVQRRIRQKLSVNERPLPRLEGFEEQVIALVEYIQKEKESELCVLEAFRMLVLLHQLQLGAKFSGRPLSRVHKPEAKSAIAVPELVPLLCDAIKHNFVSEEVCVIGMEALGFLIQKLPARSMPELSVVVELVVQCLKEHTEAADVNAAGGNLACLISANKANVAKLGESGVVQLLCNSLQRMDEYLEPAKLQHFYTSVCDGLRALCSHARNVKIAQIDCDMLTTLIRLVVKYEQNAEILASLTGFLFSITNCDLSQHQILSSGIILHLMRVAERHVHHAKLFLNVLLILISFAQHSDQVAFAVCESTSNDSSEVRTCVNLIGKAFDHHRDNLEIVQAACNLTDALTTEQTILNYLPSKWVLTDTLRLFAARYHDYEPIADACGKLGSRLKQGQ